MIKIEQLTKTFTSRSGQVEALRGIDLTIEDGDIFGIIGMSGAGKSTLLRCLCLLEQPTTGAVLLDGVNASRLTGRKLLSLRRRMGVVFQGYNLLMQKTVRENVAFPLTLAGVSAGETTERVETLLDLVGLADKADAYPSQLSGGQRQRVAIARALATDPEVLYCDEPTSALDSLTTQAMLELLRNINQKMGVTIVIITHEMSVVRRICNKVAVIDGGEVVERGETSVIFEAPQAPVTLQLLGVGA